MGWGRRQSYGGDDGGARQGTARTRQKIGRGHVSEGWGRFGEIYGGSSLANAFERPQICSTYWLGLRGVRQPGHMGWVWRVRLGGCFWFGHCPVCPPGHIGEKCVWGGGGGPVGDAPKRKKRSKLSGLGSTNSSLS